MDNPKISIIVNFYNSERYIPKLIKSILNQTYSNWEIIAVNDCSPGKDLKLLRKYQSSESMKGRMIIVDNKENLGISKAKAEGIKNATGKYITFMDGDDWLEPEALERLLEPAEKYSLDLVIGNCYRVFPYKKRVLKSNGVCYNIIYDKQRIEDEILIGFLGINMLSSYAYWAKLFNLSTLRKSKYVPFEGVIYEDIFFNLEFILIAEKIMFVDFPVYNWRWGGLSSSASAKLNVYFNQEEIIKKFNEFYFKRIKIIETFGKYKYLEPLKIELFNVFRFNASYICRYNPKTKKAIKAKQTLLKLISLPAYQYLGDLQNHPYVNNSEFIIACKSKNVDLIYNYLYIFYKNRIKEIIYRQIISYISKFFNIFN